MKTSLVVGSLAIFLGMGIGSQELGTIVPAIASPSLQLAQATTPSTAPITTPTATPAAQMELLDAGSEPRQLLRFAVPANLNQTARMRMDMNVAVAVNNEAMSPFDAPAINMTIGVKANPINDQGDIRVEFAYTDVSVDETATMPPEVLGMVRSQIQPLLGIQGTYVINNRGQVLESDINLPATSDPITQMVYQQINGSVLQAASDPFPEMPLGQGARWRVNTAIPGTLIPLTGVATYEITGLQGNSLVLNSTIVSQADAQSLTGSDGVNLPANMFPPDFKMNLRSLNIQGDGTTTLRLDQIMPLQSTVLTTANMSFDLTLPDDRQIPMTMQSRVTMTMEAI